MGAWKPFPLPDGSYSDETRPWSQQDVVNYLPTKAELPGARSRMKYIPCPGMEAFAKIGYGPYRGMRDVEGKLFVVAGNRLFQISTTGIAIPIGTIPGTARVSMTHNQIDGGNQLLIGTRDNSYLYDTTTDTLAATGIPLQSVDFLNQRFLGIDSQRRFWRYSDLADGSSGAWNTLNNESAESSPDRIVGGIVASGYWWVFGERTIEVFANAPNGNTTFSRAVVIEKGCANAETIKRLASTVFFLGNDSIVYRMQGYEPVPVSPKALTTAFRACDPAKALAYTYEDNGYLIYYLTFQDGQTWGYDVTNQRWHRRESFGLDRWRLNTLTKWNGDWYGGDYSNDTLYRLKWRYAYEGQDIFPRLIRTGVMHNNGNRMRVHGLKVLANTGLPESLPSVAPAQPDGPTIIGAAPDGIVGQAYAGYAYTVTAGDAAIVAVTLRSGSLPPEITLSTAGVLGTGTPTDAANYSFTLRVTDANGLWAELSDSIAIGAIDWIATDGAGNFNLSTGTDWTTLAKFSASATGLFMRALNGRLLLSSDFSGTGTQTHYSDDKGASWQETAIPSGGLPTGSYKTAVFDNEFWLLASNSGDILHGDGAQLDKTTLAFPRQGPVSINGALGYQVLGCQYNDGNIPVEVSTDYFATHAWQYIAVADDVTLCVSNGSRILVGGTNSLKVQYTDNGSGWSSAYTLPSIGSALRGGAAEANVWVIIANSGIAVSIDNGATFTAVTLSEEFHPYDVQIGGGLIVAVGEKNNGAGTGRIWTASLSDPYTWTKRDNNFGFDAIKAVAFMGAA